MPETTKPKGTARRKAAPKPKAEPKPPEAAEPEAAEPEAVDLRTLPVEADLPSVAARLAGIRSAVSSVPKGGRNDHHGYSYAMWTDVVEAVREHLDRACLHLHLSARGAQTVSPGTWLVTFDFEWRCTRSGESLGGQWFGTGYDEGDKGLYKAYSGALKYLVLDTFLIPTGDDPEGGAQPPEDGSATPGRDPVPLIPRERAQRIVELAKQNGMAEAVFKAALHDRNVSRVVDLTVDQAEDLERFIETEAGVRS